MRCCINKTVSISSDPFEPKGLPIKFSWTTTIDVDGNAVTTPMRVEHASQNGVQNA